MYVNVRTWRMVQTVSTIQYASRWPRGKPSLEALSTTEVRDTKPQTAALLFFAL